MATRHPGVRRWRVEPVDRPQEINATTSHTYRRHAPGGGHVIPYPTTSAPSISLALAMAGREAIVQLLGLRSQGHLFGAGLTKGARAKGQG
jgi:hypothetical protein